MVKIQDAALYCVVWLTTTMTIPRSRTQFNSTSRSSLTSLLCSVLLSSIRLVSLPNNNKNIKTQIYAPIAEVSPNKNNGQIEISKRHKKNWRAYPITK